MSASDYAENKIADHLLSTTSWTMPSQVYVKLHTGDPGEAGTANAAGETTRQAANWSSASSGSASLSGTVSWTGVSTGETYTHVSLWDASSGGNCLASGAMGSSVAVSSGYNFNLTAMTVTVS
jgi:hypothetical protein